MKAFELAEVARISGTPLTRAKNWTVGRPFKIEPSIHTATGTGSRNLYSVEDVYLMALADSLSRSGMAAMAIGKLLDAVKAKWPTGLGGVKSMVAWRERERPSSRKERLRFQVREGESKPAAEVWHAVDVTSLVGRINSAVGKQKRSN